MTHPRDDVFTGNEHAQVFAYYASDDEFLLDTEEQIDMLAFREWVAKLDTDD